MEALKIFKSMEICRQGACSECPYKEEPECMNVLKDELFNLFYAREGDDQ